MFSRLQARLEAWNKPLVLRVQIASLLLLAVCCAVSAFREMQVSNWWLASIEALFCWWLVEDAHSFWSRLHK